MSLPTIITLQTGEVAVVRCTWRRDGDLYDPPTVRCTIRRGGTAETLAATRDSQGVYTALVKGLNPGQVHVLFEADGTGLEDGAQEGIVVFEKTAFPGRAA